MDPVTVIFVLLTGAVVLIALEFLLPTHGMLGVAAAAAACGAVVAAFDVDRRLGIGLFAALVVSAPVLATLMLAIYERSPVGRRTMLRHVTPAPAHERILPGDVGRTRTVLRPMGEADFGPVVVQVTSHLGTPIPPNTPVRVVDYHDGIARVEPIAQPNASASA